MTELSPKEHVARRRMLIVAGSIVGLLALVCGFGLGYFQGNLVALLFQDLDAEHHTIWSVSPSPHGNFLAISMSTEPVTLGATVGYSVDVMIVPAADFPEALVRPNREYIFQSYQYEEHELEWINNARLKLAWPAAAHSQPPPTHNWNGFTLEVRPSSDLPARPS